MPEPWGRIASFDVKVGDRKSKETSDVSTWLSVTLHPEAGGPPVTIELRFQDAHSRKEADQQYRLAKKLENLLDTCVKNITVQTSD